MTPLHQQLLDTLREVEIIRGCIVHTNELALRLEAEAREEDIE